MSLIVVQVNSNRSSSSHDLVEELASRVEADFILFSEPNKNYIKEKALICDEGSDVAIVRSSNKHGVIKAGSVPGVAWVDLERCTLLSCYKTPNCEMAELEEWVDSLGELVRSFNKSVVLCGDFNAKNILWGGEVTNARGRLLEDLIAENRLLVINDGSGPTFRRGLSQYFIDVSMVSDELAGSIAGWQVMEEEVMSDHTPILMKIAARCDRVAETKLRGCSLTEQELARFEDAVRDELMRRHPCALITPDILTAITVEIRNKVSRPKGRRERRVCWWCEEV